MKIFNLSSPSFLSNQKGQFVVMLALIFPLLILLLAFFVNLSLLIQQKMRLQNAVDAGVYSATASLARDLNHIANLNEQIETLYEAQIEDENEPGAQSNAECPWDKPSLKKYLKDNSLHNKFDETVFVQYNNKYNDCVDIIDDINKHAFAKATEVGNMAVLLTYYDGKIPPANPMRVQFESFYEKLYDITGEEIMMKYNLFKKEETGDYIGSDDGDCTLNPGCFDLENNEGGKTITQKVNLPIQKASKVYLVGKASADAGFVNLMPNFFRVRSSHYKGSSQIHMEAYAAGQPFGGSVEGYMNTYRASLIPIGDLQKDENGNEFYH